MLCLTPPLFTRTIARNRIVPVTSAIAAAALYAYDPSLCVSVTRTFRAQTKEQRAVQQAAGNQCTAPTQARRVSCTTRMLSPITALEYRGFDSVSTAIRLSNAVQFSSTMGVHFEGRVPPEPHSRILVWLPG